MEKRVFFKGWWLPALLVAPQLLISFVFFFYPSGQAIWNSLFLPDPFGLKTEFVGLCLIKKKDVGKISSDFLLI